LVTLYSGADKSLARPDWKKLLKCRHFRPTRRSLLPRRPGWTDNLLNYFCVASESLSLVAIACFLPGRAKDLSAPRHCAQWQKVTWHSIFHTLALVSS